MVLAFLVRARNIGSCKIHATAAEAHAPRLRTVAGVISRRRTKCSIRPTANLNRSLGNLRQLVAFAARARQGVVGFGVREEAFGLAGIGALPESLLRLNYFLVRQATVVDVEIGIEDRLALSTHESRLGLDPFTGFLLPGIIK